MFAAPREDDSGGISLPVEIWPVLAGKLWHATHVDKALAIIADCEIRPNAPSTYPNGYCRSQGGISLFDFRGPEDNAVKALLCSWPRWLSGHHADGEDEIGVWFEIFPRCIATDIPAAEIHQRWYNNRVFDEQGQLRFRDPMPHCDACWIGTISIEAIIGVLLVDARRLDDHLYVDAGDNLSAKISDFRARVRAKPPMPLTLADILSDARSRAANSIR